MLKKDGLSDDDIQTLSEAMQSQKIEFIFDSTEPRLDHHDNGYKLTYEQGGQTKETLISVKPFIATGADVENSLGLPDHLIAKSGSMIVDKAPELIGRPNNNDTMIASGLNCIIKQGEKLTPLIGVGDCVSDSDGKHGPQVLVHAFAGAKAQYENIRNMLSNPNMVRGLAEQHPELIVKM